ncbi:MAG: sterol desaturase family protein [Myxococcales bacterium]|nr:sterol desaturase family protein [Myxococcales bacterium]
MSEDDDYYLDATNLKRRPNLTGSGRQFKSDLLEPFSRCHGLVPLFVYGPLVFWLLWLSVERGLAAGTILGYFAVGVFVWTFAEYWMHRVIFHFEKIPKLHYFLHGIHHDYPNDRSRLVMPPGASALPALGFWLLARAIVGDTLALPAFAGFGVGYLWYDMTHFWTHVARPRTRWGKFLRRHHMLHHFKTPNRRFGVSTPLWDLVFRTFR